MSKKQKSIKTNVDDKLQRVLIDPNSITPVRKYYIKNFKKKYINFDMSKNLQEYFDSDEYDRNYLYGSYNRLNSYVIFAYKMNIDIVNTICATYKIRDMINDKEAIFAFGYYEDRKSYKKDEGITMHGTSTVMNYFVLGGSFTSRDGEYRSCIISQTNIKKINTGVQKNIKNDIVTYFREILPERKILITKEYFYPTDAKKEIEPKLEYYSYILQYELFSLAWFILMYNYKLNIVETNINPKYTDIMLQYIKKDIIFYDQLVKKYSSKEINKLMILVNNILFGNITSMKLGQKIIPLSISESQNPFNIQYKPWREYLISIHLSDLVVNFVSPGFFITNQWFYIKNSRKGLFDNEVQYEKMERSELAEQIVSLLIRANAYTHENITNRPDNKKILASWISNKFKILSDKIQDPIKYTKEEIIMSNVALCFISEYVGRTIMDVLTISKSSKYYNNIIGNPFQKIGFPIFQKYMFDICYNLYCMNYRSGIIHGDLHLNNATLRQSLYKDIRDINTINNPKVLYVLGNTKYLLPTVSYNTCIIDFSRCVILPEKIANLQDPSLPKSYEITTNLNEFQKYQVDILLRLYINNTTDSDHNKDDLRILFRNKFEAVFKILTVTDIYSFTKKLELVFNIDKSNVVTPSNSCIDFIKKINKESFIFLTEEMTKLITDPTYEKHVLDMEYPLYTIIKKCFSTYLVNELSIVGNIIDVFNIDNKLEYSLSKQSMFPDFISKPKSIVNNKIVDLSTEPLMKQFNKTRLSYEKEKNDGLKVVNYIADRQKEKHF